MARKSWFRARTTGLIERLLELPWREPVGNSAYPAAESTGRTLRIELLEDRWLLSAAVGDLVWRDMDADGIQEAGDLGIGGASAELYSSTNAVVGDSDDLLRSVVTTDASGNYSFTDLAAGNYYLVFRAPSGYAFSSQDQGTDDTLDSDVAPSTGRTAMFTLNPGQNRTDLDVGLVGAAPWFGFALRAGGLSNESGESVAVDAAGNTYVAGNFSGTADFDPGPGTCNLTGAGDYDVVVAKYTAGGALAWARALGGTGTDHAYGIAVDSGGNVYTTGSFSGAVDFDPGVGVSNLISAGGSDIFVSKLDASGNFVWARALGGTGTDYGRGIAVDSGGNVYTTGSFSGAVDFDPGVGVSNLISAGGSDIFVSKLDASGNFVWARALGGTSTDSGYGIAVDSGGNVYTTGSFSGAVDFDPGVGVSNLISAGGSDIFVSKLDASGNFVWARALGGTSTDSGYGIAVDSGGNVYTTGYFNDTADFDPGAGASSLTSAGGGDIFVSKLDASGNFAWARAMGGTDYDIAAGIAVDSEDNVYTTGYFYDTADFDPGAGASYLTSAGGGDIFVSKLDTSGNFAWARAMGGTDFDHADGIAVDSGGNVYTTGSFQGGADFDPNARTSILISESGSPDLFVSKLLPPHAPTDLGLSPTGVVEHLPASTPVGRLSSTDADVGDAFTYALVSGAGSTDNAWFTIADDRLLTNASFDWATKNSYSIRVRSTDLEGLWMEEAFTISVVRAIDVGSIGNVVWNDTDADGIHDAGEPGVAGIPVELFCSADALIGNADDSSLGVAISDASGQYAFTNLVSEANYYLALRAASGYAFSSQNQGTDDTLDSDVAPSTGRTAMFTLSPGETRTDLDAGLVGAAPWFGFALGAGGVSSDLGQSVAVDAAGNAYVVGSFRGTADFDPGPGTCILTGAGDDDVVAAKYTAGGALVWARAMGGTGTDHAYGIAVDSEGNVYTTGYFSGTADFDPGGGTSNLTSAGGYDIFVSKLDASGNFVWARAMGGTSGSSMDIAYGIAVDTGGNIYTTGSFYGTADFDPGAGASSLTSAGEIDIFVSKLDAAGNFVWARALGGTNWDYAYGIAVDSEGNVYTTGRFRGTADFDPGAATINLTSAGGYDIFVSKLDASGNFVWARAMGGNSDDVAYGMAVDSGGNVYTTGHFSETVDFDPGAGTSNLTSVGAYDIFVSKLDASGNFAWGRRMGGQSTDNGYGIAVDSEGNVYTTGSFYGTADFGPGPGTSNLTSAGGNDIFISKLDTSGNFVWARALGGTSVDHANGIAVDSGGNVYTTGYFYDTADFDPGAGASYLTSAGGGDIFVSRLLPPHAPADISLWPGTVVEHQAAGALVVGLSSNDADSGEVFNYSLVAGSGDTDNGLFTLVGRELRTSVVFDHATQNSYSIRVRSTDCEGLWVESPLMVTVLPESEGATVSDWVWRDVNGNGIQDDSGQAGLSGVLVELFFSADGTIGNGDDVCVAQATTDGVGHYWLDHLVTGTNYYLAFKAPTGYTFGPPDAGEDDSLDSDAAADGVTALFTAVAGQTRTDLDAGLVGAAPWFGFALGAGGVSTDSGRSVAIDAAGNAYVVGSFRGTVDFDPGPGTCILTSVGNDDVVVAKYTASGVLAWARAMGGTSYDYGYSIAVDSGGNVYTTGEFSGVADFCPGVGVSNLTSVGGSDIFVCKLNAFGNFVWARAMGGTSYDYGYSIAVDSGGNVYATGSFYGTADFDPGPADYYLNGVSRAIFVSKLDASGNFAWARGMRYGAGKGIAVDSGGNVYTTGSFSGAVDFDPGVGVSNLTSAGGYDIFVSKLDDSGNFVWARAAGGTSDDVACGIAVDSEGNVYTTGYFSGTADFDPGVGTSNLTSAGGNDIFISKLDTSGNFAWARALGGTNDDRGNSIAVGSGGSVYTTGSFYGTADFDPGAGASNLTSAGGTDIFVSKLDASGNLAWARAVGGTGTDDGYGIAVDSGSSVYTTGNYTGAVDFDPGPADYYLNSAGGLDFFFSKMALDALDADGNGSADALSDGILILRYLFDPTGAWNVNDALGSGATLTSREAIKSCLDFAQGNVLDADGNGTADALSDGILILRYLFDPAGAWNVGDALGSGATRTTREAIRAYLDGFNPGLSPAPPTLMASSSSSQATSPQSQATTSSKADFTVSPTESVAAGLESAAQADANQLRGAISRTVVIGGTSATSFTVAVPTSMPEEGRRLAVDTALKSWSEPTGYDVGTSWMPIRPIVGDANMTDRMAIDAIWGEGDLDGFLTQLEDRVDLDVETPELAMAL